jgi:predicted alpha/beta hydrolase
MQSLSLVSADGPPVAARRFGPADDAPVLGGVVIGGAMGVRQDYYEPFARWLADQGYVVLTFDYRGVGDSLPLGRSLRGFEADLFAWARDFDRVIEALDREVPALPIYLIGHSLGAQLPGLLTQRHRVAGLVSVASGSGYWRDNAPALRRSVLYLWYVLVPIATLLFGYFPGRRLGKVGDLPRGVMLQWRRWCLNPRYHVGAEGARVRDRFASVRFPLVALSMTDDEMMTERGTRVLVDCYANAPRRIERIAPADLQVPRIGHFGFFRHQFQSSLWMRAAALLRAFPPVEQTA